MGVSDCKRITIVCPFCEAKVKQIAELKAQLAAAEAALADALRFAHFLTEQHPFDGTDHLMLPGHGWRKLCGMLSRPAPAAEQPERKEQP